MFRKPLRTQNGCDRCRSRHKKCDEGKPTCINCSRLNLECTWNRMRNKNITPVKVDVVNSETVGHALPESVKIQRVPRSLRDSLYGFGPGYQSFRDQAQFDLTVWSPTALQGLVSSSAASPFHDTSMLLTIGLQNSWVRDALSAFSAYSLLTISKDDKKWERIAIEMYQRALSAVRSHISVTQRSAATLQTLVAVTFLGLSESLGEGDALQAIVHFSAAAMICKTMPFDTVNSPAGRRIYQIAVECWLYNLATLALFSPDCGHIERCIQWSVLKDCFSADSTNVNASLRKSPFVGGCHEIYKITFEMTCFARQVAPKPVRQTQTQKWVLKLNKLQQGLPQYYSMLSNDVASLYHSKFLLHITALRIFLAKIANHRLKASSPEIYSYIGAARDLFRSNSTQESRNPALAWPLIVLLCAANKDDSFEFFIQTINDIRDNFDTGHARRMDLVLAIVKQYRASNLNTLDLLLRKRGILVPDSD